MAGLTQALRIEAAAPTASFRYPRVQVGRLPTFDMPPPATVYGILAAVLGEWFDPSGLAFSYSFHHSGKAADLETFHPIERASGKPKYKKRGWDFPVNVECSTNVQFREFLVHPRLTLYLQCPNLDLLYRLRAAFLSPYFSLLLGRSQDLATCLSSQFIELGRSPDAFFADTLLPFDWRPWVSPGVTVLLPSRIDYTRLRSATHDRYLQVSRPPLHVFPGAADLTDRSQLPELFFTDPQDTREVSGRILARGLHFWPVPHSAAPES